MKNTRDLAIIHCKPEVPPFSSCVFFSAVFFPPPAHPLILNLGEKQEIKLQWPKKFL